MRFALSIGGVFAVSALTPAYAGVFTDDLSRCIVQKTTDADKLELVRWMFAAVTKDPALASMTNLKDVQRDRINTDMSHLYDRLFLTDCRKETIAALKNEGMGSLIEAGQALGGAASRQLLTSPAGQKELGEFADKMDLEAWKALGKEAGVELPAD